jgi:CRISPR-associated endonuclease/helicase Cas3
MILANHAHYWAHIHSEKDPESLKAHITLVNKYFLLLVEVHGLEVVIDRLINDYVKEWPDKVKAAELMKLQFTHVVVFHDFGKVNENFQVLRMHNTTRFKANPATILKPPHGHSFLSVFLFLAYHIDLIVKQQISEEAKSLLICHCFFLVYSILQHHSPVLSNASSKDYLGAFRGLTESLNAYAQQYGQSFDKEMLDGALKCIYEIWDGELEANPDIVSFPLFALIKLNFSLLTAADYLATHEYMNSSEGGSEAKTSDFGILEDQGRLKDIIHHLQSYKHNKESFANVENYVFSHPQDKSNENLNRLRQEMAVEVIQTIRTNADKKLFYIEAPTGGGKTNLSIITVTELLAANPELTKVFYVFPFTTLITQTYKTLKDTLGLQDHEIVELHSKASFESKSKEERQDGLYGNEKKDYIDNLFALYPITLLSHVKFFDILKTNRKETNYLLHRLANSIVIIDEIQSYNPLIWDKMLYFISQYSVYFNVKFVLMSATLPKISSLNIGLTQKPSFVELLPNARKYIANENFSERVSFNFEMFNGEISLDSLAEAVIEKSNRYSKKNGSVRTIIEFIYKKSASGFQQLISQMANSFDEIFVLSGTVLESRRREIINFIKRTAKSDINILLITTQVVEAGVDIDMDLGFKNVSLIDSDEQLAGRVNRNAFKNDCEVYLFKLDDARMLYGKDYRYQQTRENITVEEHQQILKEKDFRRLYEKVIKVIDTTNELPFKNNFSSYENDLLNLRFNKVDEQFKIIDQDNESVFIPLKIPVTIEGSEYGIVDEIFSSKDLAFLNQFGVRPVENYLDGSEIWGVYETLINQGTQKRKDKMGFDIKAKIDFRTLQGIISKFTFSLMLYSKDYQSIRDGFGEEKFGYMYFSHWDDVRTEGKAYSYEYGLNSKAFNDANFI